MKRFTFAFTVALLATGCQSGQGPSSNYALPIEPQRFQLYTGCAPVGVFVSDLSKDAIGIGLTKAAIQASVRNALRLHLIYTPEEQPSITLRLSVQVYRGAFAITLALIKPIWDYFTESMKPAITWHFSSMGTHAGDVEHILFHVRLLVWQFIDHYRTINEGDCER